MRETGTLLVVLLVTLLLSVFSGCAAGAPESESAAAPAPGRPDLAAALAGYDLVDLSYPYSDDTLYWPTDTQGFELDEVAYGETEGGYFYSAYRLATAEHGGTHLDSPIHFAADHWTVDQIPLHRLIVPAVVIDVTAAAAADRDYLLSRAEVEAWEARHGEVPAGSAVLLRTGWGRYWPDATGYLGDDTPGDASNLHFPSYGEEAARLLVEERRVAALGVDTASIDYGASTDFIVHRIANGENVLGLENVANLERVPETGAWIAALPMKIEGGSGAPVRIVGFVPKAP